MANKKRNKYSTWAKNFGQSVRFGAKEVLSEMSPSVAETIGSLPEDMRELKQDIRQLRSNKRQIVNYLLGEEEQFSKYAGIAWKNAKQSAKTGKLIDTKREEKLTMEAMGMDDMGFDDFDSGSNDSFDFNDSESGGSFEDLDIGPSKIVNLTGPSNRAIGAVNESILEATEAVNVGFDRMDRSGKNAFAMSEALQKHFHSESMSKLDAINNNLTSIVQFSSDSLGTFVQASMEYYDKNLAVLNSINEAMLRISPPPKEKKELSKLENPIEMFMNGGFSLKGYAQLVAKNAKKSFDNGMLTGMIPMLNNEMLLSGLAANPIGSIMKLGMEAMIPDRFKKSLGQMDKTASNFIPAILTKLGEYKGENSFVSLLSEIFGVKTDKSVKRFRQGDYERGPMPFDGETKVAITRVIPGYLSRMTAILETIALSMKYGPRSESDLEMMIQEKGIIYNGSGEGDSAGSFMRRRDAIKTQQREERNVITRSYSDSRFDLRSAMNSVSKADRNTEIDDYLVGLTHSKEPMKPGDLDQIKKFMWIGAHNGKNPQGDEYKKDISDEAASDMQKVFDLLKVDKKGIMVGMYGSERHAARTNLSNYNRGYGSETEYGSGRKQFLSTINKGSALDLREDKDAFTLVNREWEITKDEYGDYSMPSKKLEEFNERYGTRTKRYKNAKDVYVFLQKMKGTNGGKTEAEENVTKETEKTLTQQIKNIIEAPFNKMADLFDKVNEKMYEVIFGKDGLGGNIEELLLGKKDEKGRYSDGWFSEAINGVKDTYASTKNYLFGGVDEKGEKVPGILSNTVGKFGSIMNKYFFGEEEEVIGPDGKKTTKKKPSVLDKMKSTIVHGFGELASTFFGGGKGGRGREKSLEQAKQAFNKAIPDIGKGAGMGAVVGTVSGLGGFGLLGTLFLPGGPIGGAIVGSAMGLLSQSKGFREMLFGKEVKGKDGKITRVGGLISSKVQNFFKRKKVPIIGGAAMGTISTAMGHGIAFGLMPTIAVGAFGPVIAGAAWGLMSHSKKFREIFFGKETKGADGKTRRIGGLLNNKMMRSIKIAVPRGLAGALTGMVGMGVISQFGLIGSMIATGPIPAAILGAATGIASGSKKFTQYMFGYTDKSGKYHSGAMDRMKNYFTWEIMEPMKLYISENIFKGKMWVRRYVYAPLREAFMPLKFTLEDIGKYLTDRLKLGVNAISDGFHFVFKTVAENIATVMKPIIDMTKTMAEWTVRRFKSALSMSIKLALLPLRAMGGLLGWMVKGRDYKSGVLTAARGVGSAIMAGTGVLGAVGNLGKAMLSPDESDDRMKKFRADEARQRRIEEKAFQKGSMKFADARRRMEEQQRKMRAGGYNLTDEQIEAMRKREIDKGEEMEALKDQISKSDDLGNKMLSAINDGQNEANDYLGQVRDMLEAQQEFDKSENGLFYTTMAGVHGGLKKLGLSGEELTGSMTEIIKENITNPQDIANNYLKIIADNSTETLTVTKDVAETEGETTVGKGKKRGKRNRQIEKAKKQRKNAPEVITDTDGNVYSMIGRRRKGGTRDNKLADIYKGKVFGASGLATASQQEGINFDMIAGADTTVHDDDNASIVDAKNRMVKVQEEAIERDEQKTTFLGTIADWCKKKMGVDKDKKSSWWQKLLDIGGGFLSGLFTVGKIALGIGGIIAFIANILSFGFGGQDRRRKMIDSDAMGNMMTRGIRGGMKFGARAGIKLIDFMGEKVKDRQFIGKSYAVAADGTRTHVGNLYTKGQNRWESMMEKLHNITGKVSDKVKGAITKPDEQKGLIDKLLTAGSKALESIKNMDFIKNKKLPKAESVITVFQAVIDSVKKLMMKPKFMQRIAEYMATKGAGSVARGALKTGLGLLTGGMATVAFGAYDGVSGMARAGFYFDVNDEDVDWRMRIISGAVNAFFGLPLMFVYDFALSMISLGIQNVGDSPLGKLLSEFGINLANFDHRKAIAQLIYRMTADEVDVSKLDESQKKLLSEYKAYIDSHPDENMSLEEFQDKVKGQGGLWQKYGAPILNRIFGVDPLKNQGKTFMDRVHDAYEGLVKWFNNAVDQILNFHPLDYIKDKLSELFTPIKERWDKFTDFGNGGLSDEHKDKVGTWDRFKNGIANFFKRDKDAKAVGSSKIFGGNGKGFSQGDARWKNKSFGSSNFDLEACGPLALANITGRDPRMLAAMANPNDFAGSGIKPSYFRHTAGQLGLGYRENNTSQDMYAGLLSGKPMIVGGSSSNPNSPFYGNGHYVVANGLDSKGNANIYNPAGHGKSMSVDPKTLIRESLGHGGYSGSFSGGGRMSISEAMKNDSTITPEDVKRYEEEQAQKREEYNQYLMDKDLSTEDLSFDDYIKKVNKEEGIRGITNTEREKLLALNALKNRSTHSDTNIVRDTVVDEETAAKADKKDGITAKTDGTTETTTHADGSVTTRNTKTGKTFRTTGSSVTGSKSNEELGLMDILTGFGLGLANLFSAVWSGEKYKNVTISDIKNGIGAKISSLFGKNKGTGHRGNGVPDDIGKLEVEPPNGKYWVRQNGNVKLKGCHSQVVDVLETLGQWFFENTGHKLVVTAGTNGRHAEGKYSHAQGWKVDVNDWYGPENLQGGYITDGNQLTQPFKEFGHSCGLGMADEGDHIDVQFADGYDWQDGKTYGGWSTHGGGGGSIDTSAGHIDTKKAVWNYLVNDLEINRAGAAGIMGNIEQESGFDTSAYNPNDNGGPSGGLVQWHNTRFTNLQNYASNIGKPWQDIDSQMGYLSQELNEGTHCPGVYDEIQNAPSVRSAVDTWVRGFERPANMQGEINHRTPMAESFYNDHENFVGGANGFMSQPQMMMPGFGMMQSGGSSANALAAVLTGGLFNWKRRYDERGRLKKVDQLRKMINAGVPESQIPNNLLKYKAYLNEASGGIDPVKVLNDYANAHTTQEPVNATVRNATADRILPAKVDTGGASMDDLLISIRALDSHAELNQIISYLAAIAENGGTGRNFIFDRKSDINMHRQIEMTKRDLRDASSKRILSRPALNNLENVLGDIDGLPVNSLALAQEIAKGGKFRTS